MKNLKYIVENELKSLLDTTQNAKSIHIIEKFKRILWSFSNEAKELKEESDLFTLKNTIVSRLSTSYIQMDRCLNELKYLSEQAKKTNIKPSIDIQASILRYEKNIAGLNKLRDEIQQNGLIEPENVEKDKLNSYLEAISRLMEVHQVFAKEVRTAYDQFQMQLSKSSGPKKQADKRKLKKNSRPVLFQIHLQVLLLMIVIPLLVPMASQLRIRPRILSRPQSRKLLFILN